MLHDVHSDKRIKIVAKMALRVNGRSIIRKVRFKWNYEIFGKRLKVTNQDLAR